jgi:ribosomal protein RSM22 (predicted rRNA methylase)
MLALPEKLEAAIREILKTTPAAQWKREAHALSRRYRGSRETLPRSFARGDEQAIAYLAQIFPATFAQLYGAMAATKAQAPNWSPQSLLDIGSGPGTALCAAVEHWPALTKLEAWEREPAFIKLAEKIARAGLQQVGRETQWQQIDLRLQLPRQQHQYDLIIIGHVLNELNASDQRRVVAWAWEHCAGVLLIVEPGTAAAFLALKNLREQLLALGAKTLAPCPHDKPCPLINDWCHFPQRLQRPQFQRRAKAATSPWEECKFSYAAMARFAPARAPWARIIRETQVTKAYAEAQLCAAEGILRQRENKKDREAFKRAKKLLWGATIDAPFSSDHPADSLSQ